MSSRFNVKLISVLLRNNWHSVFARKFLRGMILKVQWEQANPTWRVAIKVLGSKFTFYRPISQTILSTSNVDIHNFQARKYCY